MLVLGMPKLHRKIECWNSRQFRLWQISHVRIRWQFRKLGALQALSGSSDTSGFGSSCNWGILSFGDSSNSGLCSGSSLGNSGFGSSVPQINVVTKSSLTSAWMAYQLINDKVMSSSGNVKDGELCLQVVHCIFR
ncbi:conserved hypothetical protein [Ricinus communis]|uniref:Uncharacterized protein n=1 Tax=Ricinus communis TaxID=3988 RepID=B9RF00_RICCO|nr:conserved hypothetical protein [Ricinus communis]